MSISKGGKGEYERQFYCYFRHGVFSGCNNYFNHRGGVAMAGLMRKFFEMNDLDVLIIAFLYFATVIGLWIYTCKKWKEEENDKKR